MSGRTWIPVVSTPLGHSTKQLSISRGFSADVKASNSRFASLFSLQILLDYQNGYQTTIPLLSEVVAALRNFMEGTLEIPASGFFIENDSRHFIILENKNRELTLIFERNKFRSHVRLRPDEVENICRFHRLKQYLYELSKLKPNIFDMQKQKDTAGTDISLYIQLWTALSMKTRHERGTCDCYDVIEGMPCNLSLKRCAGDRVRELIRGVSLYSEVLRNILIFRELLGMNIPFDGFDERVIGMSNNPDLDNDCCFFVKTVLKQ